MSPQLKASEIPERALAAGKLSSSCGLCPRRCGVNRPSGERGYCGAGPSPTVATVVPHFGEEPPLVGVGGAGAVFFSHCNMSCVYCQNHQISQEGLGSVMLPRELADEMLTLQDMGCATIEAVSPGPHLPGLLQALGLALEDGLRLPLVYNTNGYETKETLELLEGIVDIYLPDLKYGGPDEAAAYSDTPDYVRYAREAILAMHNAVGNLVVDLHGTAVRGLILRLLVLPGHIARTQETLSWIKDNLPQTITISLMSQYAPLHKSSFFSPLDRKITPQEYEEAVDWAWDLGFENVFVQDLDSPCVGIPDFRSDKPFIWE